ncbi:MAG: hypothetical protein PHD73_07430 [Sediminibacterium sp.]|nr:hypothetical protein [Sediminibacterium sp.]
MNNLQTTDNKAVISVDIHHLFSHVQFLKPRTPAFRGARFFCPTTPPIPRIIHHYIHHFRRISSISSTCSSIIKSSFTFIFGEEDTGSVKELFRQGDFSF